MQVRSSYCPALDGCGDERRKFCCQQKRHFQLYRWNWRLSLLLLPQALNFRKLKYENFQNKVTKLFADFQKKDSSAAWPWPDLHETLTRPWRDIDQRYLPVRAIYAPCAKRVQFIHTTYQGVYKAHTRRGKGVLKALAGNTHRQQTIQSSLLGSVKHIAHIGAH